MKIENIDGVCCPFCNQEIKELPKGLEIREMAKIVKKILEKYKKEIPAPPPLFWGGVDNLTS